MMIRWLLVLTISTLLSGHNTLLAADLILDPGDKVLIRQTLASMMDCRSLKSCFPSVARRLKALNGKSPDTSCSLKEPKVKGEYIRGSTTYLPGCAFVDNRLKPYIAYPKRYWKDFDSHKLRESDVCGAQWMPSIHTMTCSNLKGLEAKININYTRCEPNDVNRCGRLIEIPGRGGKGKVLGKFKQYTTTQQMVFERSNGKDEVLFETDPMIRITVVDEHGKEVTFTGKISEVNLNHRYRFDSNLCDPGNIDSAKK